MNDQVIVSCFPWLRINIIDVSICHLKDLFIPLPPEMFSLTSAIEVAAEAANKIAITLNISFEFQRSKWNGWSKSSSRLSRKIG